MSGTGRLYVTLVDSIADPQKEPVASVTCSDRFGKLNVIEVWYPPVERPSAAVIPNASASPGHLVLNGITFRDRC